MLSLVALCAALHPSASPPLGLQLRAATELRPHAIFMVQRSPVLDNFLVRALRKVLRREKKPIVCGGTKFGCDPRGPDDYLDEECTEPLVPDDAIFPELVPGEVGELSGGVYHLNALLRAAGTERAVVLKFKRDGCPACKSTIAPLDSAAAAYIGRVDFVEVDYTRNRAFCKQCALGVVPCAHLYVAGQLAESMPLGPRAWSKFADTLVSLVGPPEGEVLSAEIPEDKNAVDARSVTGLDTYL